MKTCMPLNNCGYATLVVVVPWLEVLRVGVKVLYFSAKRV